MLLLRLMPLLLLVDLSNTWDRALIISRTLPQTVPAGLGSSTFFLPAIPDTVKAAVPLMHTVDPAATAALVDACAHALQHRDPVSSQQLSARLAQVRRRW